jgi:TonB family protein
MARAFLTVTALLIALTSSNSQSAKDCFGFYDEFWVRDRALTKAMPVYPREALEQGITEVVQVKIAINDRGEVTGIRISPNTTPLFKQAVADAVDQWRFEPSPDVPGPCRNHKSRLTFRFSISGKLLRVELYDPGPDAVDSERLGYVNTAKEARLWDHWEEVQPSRLKAN